MRRARNASTRQWREWCRRAADPRVTALALGVRKRGKPAQDVRQGGARHDRLPPRLLRRGEY